MPINTLALSKGHGLNSGRWAWRWEVALWLLWQVGSLQVLRRGEVKPNLWFTLQIVEDCLDQREIIWRSMLPHFGTRKNSICIFTRIGTIQNLTTGLCHRVRLWVFLWVEHTKCLRSLDALDSFRSHAFWSPYFVPKDKGLVWRRVEELWDLISALHWFKW